MSVSTRDHRTVAKHLTRIVGAVAAASTIVIGAIAYIAVSRADQTAEQQESAYVNLELQEQIDNIPHDQLSVTVWDDAVTHAKAADLGWIAENLGEWMFSFYKHDMAFVLNEADQPIYAMEGGASVDVSSYGAESAAVAPIISRARRSIASANRALDPAAALASVADEDLATIKGFPAIVSVRPILPSTRKISQPEGSEYLHVAVKLIDPVFVADLARHRQLAGAQLVSATASPSKASLPVKNSAGKVLAFIRWDSDRPGYRLLVQMLPALAFGGLIALLMLGLLERRLRQVSDDVEISLAHAEYLSLHDPLTGAPNRALLEDRLVQALSQGRRDNVRIGLLFLDLDGFKDVNDTLGHPAGDEMIRLVTDRLMKLVPDGDTLARLGGDEFAIVQSHVANEHDAEALAQAILDEIARPFDLSGSPSFITASVGIALSTPDGTDPHELLRKADIALYEAKRSGRHCYRLFVGDMDDVARQRRLIEQDLRSVIESGIGLQQVYQPIFASDGTTIVGAEALLRWSHPIHGMLPPELFIGIAEERGLIDDLGVWVVRKACRALAETSLPWIAVNVSPMQFRGSGPLSMILRELDYAGVSASRLQVELTEGVLLENVGASEIISELREAGIQVAIDDFGTGYSSLKYLQRYNVDKLKIDRSFVQQLGLSSGSDAIVRAMVMLAKALHMRVTAEGVENQSQREVLEAIGCHELQGFLMSRPITLGQLHSLTSAAQSRAG
jgi:diguanylate cyclase (GGDEF)-like protein